MKRHGVVSLFTMTALGLALLPGTSVAQQRTEPCGGLLARFEFQEPSDALGATAVYPGLSHDQQRVFKEAFCEDVAYVTRFFREREWIGPQGPGPLPNLPTTGLYRPGADLNVFVSDQYPRSRSLVPSWLSNRGYIEVPAKRAVSQEAPIAHELVHVFFPNGNRLLAEGLAVYVQTLISKQKNLPLEEQVVPNFGIDLDLMAHDFLCNTIKGVDSRKAVDRVIRGILSLDKISTPDELILRVGLTITNMPSATYIVAGSFIRFLVESPGGTWKTLGALYKHTPLVPFERDPGTAGRWRAEYGYSLDWLATQWWNHLDGEKWISLDGSEREPDGGITCLHPDL